MKADRCDAPHEQNKEGRKPRELLNQCRKALNKIQHPFMAKKATTGTRRKLLQRDKTTGKKPTANITPHKRQRALPLGKAGTLLSRLLLSTALGGQLTEEEGDLHGEHYGRTSLKDTEEIQINETIPRSWTANLNIVKNADIPQSICRASAISIQIPVPPLAEVKTPPSNPYGLSGASHEYANNVEKENWRTHTP